MNRAVKKFTSAALALAMAMSMGVAANAKPTSSKALLSGTAKTTGTASAATAVKPVAAAPTVTPNDYSVNLAQNQVQFLKNGQVVGTYTAKTPDIKVALSQAGNLVLNFVKEDGKAVNVGLGQQKNLVLAGSYTTLTIDGSVPNDRTFTVGGAVGTLSVNAPVAVTVSPEAKVTSLKVGSGTAKVTISAGAQVNTAAAVTASSVTGFSGSVSKAQAVTAPTATTVKPSTGKTGLSVGSSTSTTSTAGKEAVSLEMNEADTTGNTDEINFLSNNGVELIAKDGVSLGLAMKDVELKVTHDTDKDNDRVGGQWKWVDVASTTHVSGTYTYRFYPSLSSKYPTVDVTVKYVGDGSSTSSKTLGKPSISFHSKSHGAGGNVSIDVKIPKGVDDDSTVTLLVDRKEYNEWNLDEDDAGEEKTYTVNIDPSDYDFDDRDVEVRIQAKVSTGSRNSSSNTIKYRLDGKSSSSSGSVKGFSISAPSRTDEEEDFKIKAEIPSGITNPRLTASVKEGKASVGSASNVKAGQTATIRVTPKKGSDDLKIAVTLKCDEGTVVEYCYVDIDED